MHYFRISGEVEERLLSPTHTHTHSHAQRERECESARVREREAERNTREPVHAFIERAHTFIQHSRMHKQHTFFPFQGRLKNACTALHAHTHAHAGRGRERGREAHTHTKHSASHTAGLPKHLCCAVSLPDRCRKGACSRENRRRIHHSDGKILSLASQKTFIFEGPRFPSGPDK
jgi:hypothetical protein